MTFKMVSGTPIGHYAILAYRYPFIVVFNFFFICSASSGCVPAGLGQSAAHHDGLRKSMDTMWVDFFRLLGETFSPAKYADDSRSTVAVMLSGFSP